MSFSHRPHGAYRLIAGTTSVFSVLGGTLREICQGVTHVALQLASGLAVEFEAQHTLTLDTLERVKTSGIPSSFDAYKAMCRATQSRIASERVHFYERAIMLDPGYADAYSGALVRRTRGEACSF